MRIANTRKCSSILFGCIQWDYSSSGSIYEILVLLNILDFVDVGLKSRNVL
nr:MAG TPA: hypothetical protein [Caudoviricetes sp.]